MPWYANMLRQALLLFGGACCVFVEGCLHPLRTHSLSAASSLTASGSEMKESSKRFADTMTIFFAEPPPQRDRGTLVEGKSRGILLDSAIKLCTHSSIGRAVQLLLQVIENCPHSDSLHWEALFQLGECYAVKGEYRRARLLLGEIAYRNEGIPSDVHQRALVRLGHVWCREGRVNLAQEQFSRLIELYPFSPYRSVASCSTIDLFDAFGRHGYDQRRTQ